MGLMKLQQHLLQTPHQHEATRSADMGISGVKTSTQVTWLRIQCSFYCSTRQYDMLYRALETNHGPTTDQLFHLCVALISLSLHTPYVVEMLTEPCLRFAVKVNETSHWYSNQSMKIKCTLPFKAKFHLLSSKMGAESQPFHESLSSYPQPESSITFYLKVECI